jgi:hypothetical protein
MNSDNIFGMMMDVDAEAKQTQLTEKKEEEIQNDLHDSDLEELDENDLRALDLWNDKKIAKPKSQKRVRKDDDEDDEDYVDEPVKRSRGTNNKVIKRGRKKSQITKSVKNGLIYDDGAIVHFKVNTMISSAKISTGKSIRNFQVEYANAKLSDGPIVVELEIPKLMRTIKVNLNAPTMKDLLATVHKVYKRPLTANELDKIFVSNGGRTTIRLYHLLGSKVYYAGLDEISENNFRVKLKNEEDSFE